MVAHFHEAIELEEALRTVTVRLTPTPIPVTSDRHRPTFLLVVFAPMLLLGESFSTFGLIVTGAMLMGVGLLARAGGGYDARTFGTIVTIMGVLMVTAAIVLFVLLMGGLGRGI
jgi:hypothetical protein